MIHEKEKKKRRTVMKTKYALPYPTSKLEYYIKIIKAYSILSKGGKQPLSWQDFKGVVNFNPKNHISGNNEFLESLGLIQKVKGKRGYYIPTELGLKLAKALEWENETEAKIILRNILLNSWFYRSVRDLLKVQDSVTEEDILKKLGQDSGAVQKQHIIKSLKILIEFLKFAELIKEEDGRFYLIEVEHDVKESLESEVKNHESVQVKSTSRIQKTLPNIIFGILVTPETKDDDLRRIIRVILDEIEKWSEKNEKE